MGTKPKSNINFYKLINSKIEVLKKTDGIEIFDFKINKGISEKKIAKIEQYLGYQIPPIMKSFYAIVNGFNLQWNYEKDNIQLYGFIDLWKLERVFGGWDGSISKSKISNPFEDILWNDYMEEKNIKEIRQHKLIESIEGEGSFVTCKISNGEVKLYYLEDEKLKKIHADFQQYLLIIIESFGVEDIRLLTTKKSYKKRIHSYKELNILKEAQISRE